MMDSLTVVPTDRISAGDSTGRTLIDTEAVAVSNSRRRDALRCLGRFAYPVELHTLATHVVATRNDVPTEIADTDACRRMAIRLHHLDIPVLIAAGLVAYDPESRMLVRTVAEFGEQYTDVTADSHQFDAI